MGAKATIIDATGSDAVLGHIEDAAVSFDNGHGTIVGNSARQLKAVLGHGYGRRHFHLMLVACKLLNCRVVSPHVVFTYEEEEPVDFDEALPTIPEYDIDDDMQTDVPPSSPTGGSY